MKSIGEKLREAREARGWTLEELARHTRIDAEQLDAIEEDRLHALPEGPYRTAWVRTCCEVLGVEEPVDVFEVPEEPMLPLHVVRGIGLALVFVTLGVYSWAQWGRGGGPIEDTPVVQVPDQRVKVTARRNTPIAVWVDGEAAYDAILEGGGSVSFEALDRIEVEVEAVEAIRVRYNGRSIVPQGRQDAPRRLVFVDDGGR